MAVGAVDMVRNGMFLDMSFGHYKGLDLLGEEKGVPDMALTFFSMSS